MSVFQETQDAQGISRSLSSLPTTAGSLDPFQKLFKRYLSILAVSFTTAFSLGI